MVRGPRITSRKIVGMVVDGEEVVGLAACCRRTQTGVAADSPFDRAKSGSPSTDQCQNSVDFSAITSYN